MTTAPSAPPVSVPTFPAVFDGIGALVVSCALDPAALVEKLDPQTTWIAAKLTGTDTGGDAEVRHALDVWRSLGLQVGGWIYCDGPPVDDVESIGAWSLPWEPLAFVIYDVEQPYKADEGGTFAWAKALVIDHKTMQPQLPAAVTSYGGYKTSIDFAAFARAGWPIFAQVYDAFKPGDQQSYLVANGGVYGPSALVGDTVSDYGVHMLTRSLKLAPGEAVYRPESIDG